ncbi:peroxisomal membrane protein PMP34 isoform X2 [Xyrauchen texanus]|uniref:peroxisomal membrane protein PMP34 isoform X2 n=1 Tax=Xyrauchen texanus TaxID=154827 RepID=UPI0022423A51|nr:peroxisomal membrane protein PMP34 isoform X2 [Xyrauchen texanus]
MGSKDVKLLDVFSYESLVHAVAGAMGSVMAMTVFFPLDTARLRLQVDEKRKAKSTPAILSDILKEEGLLAPYRGWFPVICSLCCSNFVYFYCFHSLKANWLQGQRSTPGRDLIIGIAAGVVNVLVTTPLWVVNTRLKLQGAKFRNEDIQPTHYKGIMDAFAQIIQQEGVGALWNGTFPSLLLVMNPAVQFMIYEGLKRQLMRGVHREFGQHGQPREQSKLLNSLRSVMYLLINRVGMWGVLGLFKGLEAKLLQTVLTAALMFLLYEKIASATFRVMGVKHPVMSH